MNPADETTPPSVEEIEAFFSGTFTFGTETDEEDVDAVLTFEGDFDGMVPRIDPKELAA